MAVKDWHVGQLVVAWLTALLLAGGSYVLVVWLDASVGYSTAQLDRIALWWLVGVFLLAAIMLIVTWRWFGARPPR